MSVQITCIGFFTACRLNNNKNISICASSMIISFGVSMSMKAFGSCSVKHCACLCRFKGQLYLKLKVKKRSRLRLNCGKLHVHIQIKIVKSISNSLEYLCKDLVYYWHKERIQNSIKYNNLNTLARYDKQQTNRSCSQYNMRHEAERITEVVIMSYSVYSSSSMMCNPPERSNIKVSFTAASCCLQTEATIQRSYI